MPKVFIGVGSNLGDREKQIRLAKDLLGSIRGVRFFRCSQIRETDPVGGPPQGKYLNAVWEIETGLSPRGLLKELLMIEKTLGRDRKEKNGPRTLDLDILFYEDQVIRERNLTIPHPQLQERVFVLEPMAELEPDLVHPVLKKTIRELLNNLSATHNGQRTT